MSRLCLAFLLFTLFISAAATALATPTRFHAGVGLGGLVGFANGPTVDTGAVDPTLVVDLGARLTPTMSVYLRGEAGTIVLTSQAAAYAVGEWLPYKRLSLGTGVGVDAMTSVGSGTNKSSEWAGLSVPLIVGLALVRTKTSALRLGLEGAVGVGIATDIGWHTCLSLEWVWN